MNQVSDICVHFVISILTEYSFLEKKQIIYFYPFVQAYIYI